TDPIERLDIVGEGRAAEQSDLGGEGRLVTRQTALAFDALQHRRLLAANISAGTPPQIELHPAREPFGVELLDLLGEQHPNRRILVPQIDVNFGRFDTPSGNQRALEEAVWVTLEIPAVLEGPWLALVRVDRQE